MKLKLYNAELKCVFSPKRIWNTKSHLFGEHQSDIIVTLFELWLVWVGVPGYMLLKQMDISYQPASVDSFSKCMLWASW